MLLAEALEPGPEAAIGYLRHPQLPLARQLGGQPLPEGAINRIGQLEIVHRHPALHQGIAETAHRHEGVQQPQLVVAVGGGHGQVLHHHHDIAGRQLQGRGAEPALVQLVAQDQGEGHGVGLMGSGPALAVGLLGVVETNLALEVEAAGRATKTAGVGAHPGQVGPVARV